MLLSSISKQPAAPLTIKKTWPPGPALALRGLTLAAFATGFCATLATPARAEIMLFPTRVVMENDTRSAQVEVVNRDPTEVSFRVNLVNRRMTEDGQIVEATTPEAGEQFADGMAMFSPRLIKLAPGASQTVRIFARRPAGLADGEYRSHLQFDRLPEPSAGSNIENLAGPKPGQSSIQLTALIGASIPVIIRQGRLSATAGIEGLSLEPAHGEAAPALIFTLHRQGNKSVYGDITASYQPRSGKPVEIGNVGGVAVYVPNALRRARLPLALPAGTVLNGGTITLRYAERSSAGGATIAEAQVRVPG